MTGRKTLPDAVEAEIQQQLAELSDVLGPVCRHVMSGGRRTRALLLLCSAKPADGVDAHRAVQAAVALEMIHAATLLQDDIFDDSTYRRGRMAAHLQFSRPLAILASDWLLIRALELAATVDVRIFRSLAQAGAAMVRAEARELSPSATANLREARQAGLTIARGKTATLFATTLYAAALLQEHSEEQAKRWQELGIAMGMTYQMVDDCVDLYGTERAAGKTLAHDLQAGCITLPVLLAAETLASAWDVHWLADLQAGNLAPAHMLRLEQAVQSASVKVCVRDALNARFQAHAEDTARAGLPKAAFTLWQNELVSRLPDCLQPTAPAGTNTPVNDAFRQGQNHA